MAYPKMPDSCLCAFSGFRQADYPIPSDKLSDSSSGIQYLAPWISSPSYLSFDYALYIYNIIPEAVYSYTSATFNKGKRKTYKNKFGTYVYQDVPKAVYPYGVMAKIDGNYTYHIATCEKAICDKLYTISPVKNMKEFRYLLFEDLRIDEDNFWQLNLNDMMFLAPLYHSTNLKFLIRFINKIN